MLKKQGGTIVHCHGEFDLLHPGHIKHFEAAKKEGDVLVVTITADKHIMKGPGRPVFNQFIRQETIAAIGCVDYVAINEWPTAENTIKMLKPDVYIKGSEYTKRGKDVTGRIEKEEKIVNSLGGRVHFTDEITFSSSSLLNAHFPVYSDNATSFLKEFKKKYTIDRILENLNSIKKMKVLVIGDVIIDEYYYCSGLGKSPKNMIVTTKYDRHERFAGGVLATANHVAGFCEDVHLITCLGSRNGEEKFIRNHLKSNINSKFFYRDDAHTVVKRRFVESVFLNKLFEICFLEQKPLKEELETEIADYFKKVAAGYDLVIVADYGHEFINSILVKSICENSKFLCVNTQTNSANTGYNLITKYPRADYVCIDEAEIRLAKHDKHGEVINLIKSISSELSSQYTTVTRGYNGAMVYKNNNGFDSVPIFSDKIVDTIGAGDAFLSVTSPCAAAGFSPDLIGFIGNAVGALAVKIVCNRESVEPMPLFKFITALMK